MTKTSLQQTNTDPEATLAALRALYRDVPNPLRIRNQGMATCNLPLSIIDWTRDEGVIPGPPLGTAPLLSPPALRRDFYTGEVFVERQSNFTLRAKDLHDFTALRCIECENFHLDLEGLAIEEPPDRRGKFRLHFYACADFSIQRLVASGGRNLALLEDCDRFTVSGVDCRNYEGYGLLLLHSRFFRIQDCHFRQNLASGVMILGDCRHGLIANCHFLESRGYYNWDAGLHLCHCSRRIAAAQVPELCHEPLPIRQKTMRPSRIRVQNCVFKGNRAQGVYLEGARECLFLANSFLDNNKEGICFDWGSSLCVLKHNEIRGNGYRSDMTDAEISIDFIQDFPLLPDGSSTCKLPGISFDNGVLNAVIENRICDNFGGGVKLVRSAIANIICSNKFSNNTSATNFHVKKLHDIYILSLGNRGGEFDNNREDLLDFTSSSFNIIEFNRFTAPQGIAIHYGKEHNTFRENVFLDGTRPPSSAASSENSTGGETLHPRPPEYHLPTVSTNTLYAFGSVTGKHHAILRLNPDGTIEFSPHPNESHWRLEGEELLFFDSNFSISTRFGLYSRSGGENLFIGRFKESATIHYLVPILSTEQQPANPELPPLWLTGMPYADIELLDRLFTELGWARAGLRCRADEVIDLGGSSCIKGRRGSEQRWRYPCDFLRSSSILRSGQTLIADLKWSSDYQQALTGACCVVGTRDLRIALTAAFEADRARAEPESGPTAAWRYFSDRRDGFLAYLDLICRNGTDLTGFATWLDNAHTIRVPLETVLARTLPQDLQDKLIGLRFSPEEIRDAVTRTVDATPERMSDRPLAWEDYWSEATSHIFHASGLQLLNTRMGYH